uniref:Uncharacterized protein n=1 Tax=Octopus bimaculoides TaxID=37653 RepID=A0A0L8FPZ0_OCTBM
MEIGLVYLEYIEYQTAHLVNAYQVNLVQLCLELSVTLVNFFGHKESHPV